MCKEGDNCFLLKIGEVVVVRKLVNSEDKIFSCLMFKCLNSVKYYPFDSTKLGIFEATDLSIECNRLIETEDILHKCVRLPFQGSVFCLPLLHTTG